MYTRPLCFQQLPTACCLPGAKALAGWEGEVALVTPCLVEGKVLTQPHTEAPAQTGVR